MPSVKVLTPILGSNYYHIFNRGINRQNIFFSERNYFYFLQLINQFLSDYISVLAYCLLPNHFHLIIKVNEKIKIQSNEKANVHISQKSEGIPSLYKDEILKYKRDSISKKKMESIELTNDEEIGKFVSNQFRRLFITFTMAINKQENRTGSLFDKNFKRLEITENEYLLYAIFYAHYNPEKHRINSIFRSYKFSSYLAFCNNKTTKIDKKLVLDIYDGLDGFVNYHSVMHDEREAVIIE